MIYGGKEYNLNGNTTTIIRQKKWTKNGRKNDWPKKTKKRKKREKKKREKWTR